MRSAPFSELSFYLALFSVAAFLLIVILLIAKGGDRSFFAGLIMGGLGIISAVFSIALGVTAWKSITASPELYTGKSMLLAAFIISGIYLIVALIGIFFMLLVFSANRR